MLTDAENILKENEESSLFYLEAPTGSGKSNTAMDISFRFIKDHADIKKIYYIYPFNTLVEQNMETLKKVFGGSKEILDQIAVVNSLTPIKMSQKECILRSPAVANAFWNGRFAEHNGRPLLVD